MPKIVTLFFADESEADKFVHSIERNYYSFTRTVTTAKMNAGIKKMDKDGAVRSW